MIGEPAGPWIGLRRFLVDGPAYGGLVGPLEEAARVLRVYPSRGVGVAVVGNATSYDIDAVARLALTG